MAQSAAPCARRVAARALAAAASLAAAAAVHGATITGATPQGEVTRVQQLVLSFDVAVVALDGGRAGDPATLACQGAVPPGRGFWATPQQWVYEFRSPLSPGVSCEWRIRDAWKPLDGALGGRTRFAFRTGGPSVDRLTPFEGATIDEDQHFLVQFNGAPTEASVAAHSWCEVEGIGERVPVRLLGGATRDAVIRAERLETPAGQLVLLRCGRPLPGDARVRLVFGAGIEAAANPAVATREAAGYEYRVRRAFTAEFSCERERAQAPCMPIRPVVLRFSEAVAREQAQQVRLRAASGAGAAVAPAFDRDDPSREVRELRFPVPLSPNTRYRIELPGELKDTSGRSLANAAGFPLEFAVGEAPPIAKFAAAPFGILERLAEPTLPLTLRRVHDDLRPAAAGGQVRVLHVQEPLAMLQAYARVLALHERQVKARDAGLPAAHWYETVEESDARGRKVQRRVERWVASREVAMISTTAGARRLALPALQGGDPRPFEVVGIALPDAGLHVVEVESARLGAALLPREPGQPPAPMYVRTAVLVTNLAVHFKLGRDSSLAWVTTLDRAQPVSGAQVQVFDCTGRPQWSGRTDAQGRALIREPLVQGKGECLADVGFFVSASRRDAQGVLDTAFVFSSWTRGIDPWRFNLPTAAPGAPAEWRAHSVLDRTLLRAGETVSMKHYLRSETAAGLAPLKAAELPSQARITHDGSGQAFTVPLQWQGTRSATSAWAIPAAARLGRYQIALEAGGAPPAGDLRSAASGGFRVEEFRVPLVDARVRAPQAPLVAAHEVPLDVQLSYLAGGAVAQAALRGSAQWRERRLDFPDHPGFVFQPPREQDAPQGARDESGLETDAARLVADRVPLGTGGDGSARWVVPLAAAPLASARPGELRAEVSYLDPNGEVQTASARVPTWPSGIVLGVRTGSWASQRGQVPVTALALDIEGRPLRGVQLEVRARLLQNIATRRRLVGGLYAYDNRSEIHDLGAVCSGSTDSRGLLACEARLERAGEVELLVRAKDGAGRLAQAATTLWITRQGELWFAQDDDDRIDVLPEKTRYEPGETARLQVRMPFREATALLAIEREGVVDSRLVTLRGSDPTVEVRIEPGHAPNVYVSVLVLRGRVRHVPWYSFFSWGWKEPLAWARAFWYEGREYQAPTAMVDLAKPSFRYGVAALRVGSRAHELKVQVATERTQYPARARAVARVKVSQPDGRPAANAEVAFAAVDEGLLALAPNDSWALLEGMIRERPWSVETSTAQGEVIGRRHYGRKAVPAGGGGGRAGVRELFDTLLVWVPRVTLDANGEAAVEVPLNDSLTSFRLVAVADAGSQQFGTGQTSIRVTQDLQLLAGLPPLVREGDRFSATLTLRNTTAQALTVRARLLGTLSRAAPPGDADRGALALPARELQVPGGGAAEVAWTVDVPAGTAGIDWEASAEAIGPPAGRPPLQDRVRWRQRVEPAVPLRVLQATLHQLEQPLSLPVAPPAGALALPGRGVRGALAVTVQPRLGASLPGLRRYFESYPFVCLEQKASTAIGLRDPARWAALMQALPTYLDTDGLLAYFPPRTSDPAQGSDRLTAYLVAAAHASGYEIPQPTLDAMLQGLAAFVQGRLERRSWAPRADLEVRKLAALAALARHGRADGRMLDSIRTTPQAVAQWPTAAVIDWLTILQRTGAVPQRAARLAEADQQLRARVNVSGSTLRFSNEDDDFWWWLMDSADANAARMILAVMDDPAWRGELPRLVAGHLGRQRDGHWLTTTANAWSALALERFAATFESAGVTGRTRAGLAGAAAPQALDLASNPEGGQMLLRWPAQADTLTITHEGSGKPWVTVQALAAVAPEAPLERGYSVTRRVQAVEQKQPGVFSRGDVLRVRLELQAAADMSWVVLSDPVPAGATILGTGLGRDAVLATAGERSSGQAWAAYDERGLAAFRRYFGYLPRGSHVVEYTVRLSSAGRFVMPPTRVEAMYAPERFGETPNAVLEVQP